MHVTKSMAYSQETLNISENGLVQIPKHSFNAVFISHFLNIKLEKMVTEKSMVPTPFCVQIIMNNGDTR
jgi:hypothetical protein